MNNQNQQKRYISQDDLDNYNLLNPLINGIYEEFQELSKKKSESVLNLYKVKIVNRVLEPIRELMRDEDILNFLDILEVDDLPTNSDVILVLNHYKKAMLLFRNKYYENSEKGQYAWALK